MLHDHKKLDSADKTSKIPSNDWIVQRKAWLLQHLDSQIRFMSGFYWLVAKYSNHGLCRKVACGGPCFPRLRLSRYQASKASTTLGSSLDQCQQFLLSIPIIIIINITIYVYFIYTYASYIYIYIHIYIYIIHYISISVYHSISFKMIAVIASWSECIAAKVPVRNSPVTDSNEARLLTSARTWQGPSAASAASPSPAMGNHGKHGVKP